jgi:alpha-glucosidase
MIDYVQPGRLHSGYSFELLRTDSSAEYIRQVLETLDDRLPGPGIACHALSNHDKPRAVTRWGQGKDPSKLARQLLALMSCLKGAICLYQGDELGLPEADVPYDQLQDPFGKRFWPEFKGRDGCRTPMPWTADGGFSSATPWLPIDPRHLELNVEAQDRDPGSVLNFARQAFALRRSEAALHSGSIEFTECGPGVLAFHRRHLGRTLTCVFNLDTVEREVPVAFERSLLASGSKRVHGITMLESCGFVIYENTRVVAVPRAPVHTVAKREVLIDAPY